MINLQHFKFSQRVEGLTRNLLLLA